METIKANDVKVYDFLDGVKVEIYKSDYHINLYVEAIETSTDKLAIYEQGKRSGSFYKTRGSWFVQTGNHSGSVSVKLGREIAEIVIPALLNNAPRK